MMKFGRVKRFLLLGCWLGLMAPAVARTVELGFPGLKHRIPVVLPEGHDPAKKYPVLLYYHGQGGSPDTKLILHHTGAKDWIVVGMTYYQLGKISLTKEIMAKEGTLLRSVKKHLTDKYGMDPKRCYVAGFSKGGWMADMLLQADHSLAGGVILGAGHLHKVTKPRRHKPGKPIFIGVGRLDGNYPHAYKALLHHREYGALTQLEVWQGIGHSFPAGGSQGLMQWLSLRLNKEGLADTAKQTTQSLYDAALKLPASEQWHQLEQLRKTPYAQLPGTPWKKLITEKMKKLQEKKTISKEAEAFAKMQNLLYKEISKQDAKSLTEVLLGYQSVHRSYSETPQAKLAKHDHDRVSGLLKLVVAQEQAVKDREELAKKAREDARKNKPKIKPIVPTPGKKGRIPIQPIFR